MNNRTKINKLNTSMFGAGLYYMECNELIERAIEFLNEHLFNRAGHAPSDDPKDYVRPTTNVKDLADLIYNVTTSHIDYPIDIAIRNCISLLIAQGVTKSNSALAFVVFRFQMETVARRKYSFRPGSYYKFVTLIEKIANTAKKVSDVEKLFKTYKNKFYNLIDVDYLRCRKIEDNAVFRAIAVSLVVNEDIDNL